MLSLGVVLSSGSPAIAAAPSFLLQLPEAGITPGEGAGELDNPRGIAVEADTGHLYIADRRNARVSEYNAWGLFVKAWGWGVADGSAELQSCGPAEPESKPPSSLCRAGLPGAGKGQMALLSGGMAVDPEGNVWVGDLGNLRVQKFSPSGQFLFMLGGDVNKTTMEGGAPPEQRNVCPVDPGDVCQAGVPGEGPSQLSNLFGDYIAYSPAEGGTILVGDKGGIQVFDLGGTYVKTILFEGPLAAFAGLSVNALDVDEDGNIYFSLSGLEDLYKLDSTGGPMTPGKPAESKFEVGNPLGVTVDVQGTVYVIDDPPGASPVLEGRVLAFNAAGQRVLPTEAEAGAGQFFPYVSYLGPLVTNISTNICATSEEPGSLFVSYFASSQFSYVNGYGTPPIGCEDPPEREPEVLEQFAVSVGREEAVVKAQINPLFWPDTTYYVEYGTGKCSAGGCPNQAPVSPSLLTDKSINAPVTTAGVVLEDLLSDTTYHYRFVAESGGGGPVFGIDPDGREGSAKPTEAEGLEAAFRTFRPLSGHGACANDAVRTGESAKLPDCRALEMVSPLDKGGGDVALWNGARGQFPHELEIHQAAPSGQRFTYSSEFAFAEPEAGALFSQYIGERREGGWESEAISPPRTEASSIEFLDNDFRGFSENLCYGWVRPFSVAPLAPGAVEEYPNLYRRGNCLKPPSMGTVTTVEPINRVAAEYQLEFNGASADGARALFTANDVLVAGVPLFADRHELTLYEHGPEGLRFVCYLPNETPNPTPCAAGTTAGGAGETPVVRNAISADGSRIFWTAYEGTPGVGEESGVPGEIYVRIDGAETRKVSTTVANDPAWYWTASDDGSTAIFEFADGPHDDELYELVVDTETPTLIAGEVEGPMGASEDASRIYFASTEDLDGAGPAVTGAHNLYFYETDPGGGGGDLTFMMELADEDMDGGIRGPAPIEEVPIRRSAQVTPDGLHATFTSVVNPTPTGYDNLDANSGQPVQEVYLYDAVEDELRCLSCNPSGARPVGENIGTEIRPLWAAARIQGWEVLNHAPRVLSDDGTRVFFESFEALVPRDTNSNWDVYQWEEEGKGTCKASSETFVEESGGCVDLISSGLSAAKSTFLDADPSGDNIFFSTQSSLVKADYGLNDVYVARVGGGFPEPVEEDECEGEACQSPPPPPPEVTPSTELSAGPGNVPAAKQRKARRCPKGKRRVKRAGKVRCVKRKARSRARKTRRARR